MKYHGAYQTKILLAIKLTHKVFKDVTDIKFTKKVMSKVTDKIDKEMDPQTNSRKILLLYLQIDYTLL